MCGIAGYYGSQSLSLDRISGALSLMHRRGPDHRDWTHWTGRTAQHCYLLHSRLSIIDLDPRANQPFAIGSKQIVFNGELYNYREIQRELADAGYAFRTQSDTETLLAAIDRFGWSVLDRCEGMWSFAVLDQSDGSVTLCRDRFGEKPLYLHRNSTGLSFGSEPKFIFALLGKQLDVDRDQLYRYLINGYRALYKHEDATFFEGLRELPAGNVLRIDAAGEESCYRYWNPGWNVDENMAYEDAVAGAREKLIRSVELRLRADVPIAFCMSGGVDSNSVISIAKNVFDYDVHGFTIVNTDSRYEEQDVVEQSVRELDVRHTNIPVDTSGFLPKMRDLVAYHDSPVCTISYFAHWLLMQAVSGEGYRISVSGTAADELYTGYYDHFPFHLAEIHGERSAYEAAKAGWMRRVRPIVRNPFLQDPDAFVKNPDFRDHIFMNCDQFATFLEADWSEPFTEVSYTDRLLRNRMLNELFQESVPPMLHEDDLNAMYFSIENRSPFLDRDLCEFCYSIPTRYLIRDGFGKVVLRDSMRGIVPDCVLDNPRKVGFNAPIFSFLDVQDPEVRASLLDRSPIFDHVRRDKMEQIISKPDLPNSESKFLFYFLSSKLFLEQQAAQTANARNLESLSTTGKAA